MFDLIELRRIAAGISQRALCNAAGIHPTTYWRRKAGLSGMREANLKRLNEVLSALIEERRKALCDAA